MNSIYYTIAPHDPYSNIQFHHFYANNINQLNYATMAPPPAINENAKGDLTCLYPSVNPLAHANESKESPPPTRLKEWQIVTCPPLRCTQLLTLLTPPTLLATPLTLTSILVQFDLAQTKALRCNLHVLIITDVLQRLLQAETTRRRKNHALITT